MFPLVRLRRDIFSENILFLYALHTVTQLTMGLYYSWINLMPSYVDSEELSDHLSDWLYLAINIHNQFIFWISKIPSFIIQYFFLSLISFIPGPLDPLDTDVPTVLPFFYIKILNVTPQHLFLTKYNVCLLFLETSIYY